LSGFVFIEYRGGYKALSGFVFIEYTGGYKTRPYGGYFFAF